MDFNTMTDDVIMETIYGSSIDVALEAQAELNRRNLSDVMTELKVMDSIERLKVESGHQFKSESNAEYVVTYCAYKSGHATSDDMCDTIFTSADACIREIRDTDSKERDDVKMIESDRDYRAAAIKYLYEYNKLDKGCRIFFGEFLYDKIKTKVCIGVDMDMG